MFVKKLKSVFVKPKKDEPKEEPKTEDQEEEIKLVFHDTEELETQKKRFEGGIKKIYDEESYDAAHQFSVVSAVYNVEQYLEDFFKSIVTQTTKKENIKLIMVDDGSTDASAQIIKSWQEKYPTMISYVYKENGGVSSARNVGLEHVKTEWVTFIDADDYVSQSYFEEVDKTLLEYPDICFATCRVIYYYEDKKEYRDKHHLYRQFKKDIDIYNVIDNFMPITLAVNKTFFKVDVINKAKLLFSEEVKPDFEDAHFTNRYFLSLNCGRVVYLRKPVYYYRKRVDGSSLMNLAWQDKDMYSTVLIKGKLDLLKCAKAAKGYVPVYIQKTILYDLCWYLRRLIGNDDIAAKFASLENTFWDALKQIFGYIDTKTIWEMPNYWINSERKFALIQMFKKQQPAASHIYVEKFYFASKLMLIKTCRQDLAIYANSEKLEPVQTKRTDRMMFNRLFYSNYYQWLPLPPQNATLSFAVPNTNEEIRLRVQDKSFKKDAQMQEVFDTYKAGWDIYEKDPEGIWLFIDAAPEAGAGAMHFYKWIKDNRPQQKCYFVLSKESSQWDKLCAEDYGFIEFESEECERLVKSCSVVISEDIQTYSHPYFENSFLKSKHIICIQQKEIDNADSMLMNKRSIDLMVVASGKTYEQIVADGSKYNLTQRQVLDLSGFCESGKKGERSERDAAAKDSSAAQTHLLPFENAKCCEETYKKIAELVGGSAF